MRIFGAARHPATSISDSKTELSFRRRNSDCPRRPPRAPSIKKNDCHKKTQKTQKRPVATHSDYCPGNLLLAACLRFGEQVNCPGSSFIFCVLCVFSRPSSPSQRPGRISAQLRQLSSRRPAATDFDSRWAAGPVPSGGRLAGVHMMPRLGEILELGPITIAATCVFRLKSGGVQEAQEVQVEITGWCECALGFDPGELPFRRRDYAKLRNIR
jgi:hypothetical protein